MELPLGSVVAMGGLAAAVGGAAWSTARQLPVTCWNGIKRRTVLTVEINNDDSLFEAVMYWLGQQPVAKKTRNLRLNTLYIGRRGYPFEEGTTEEDYVPVLTLGWGTHLMKYRGHRMVVTLSEDRQNRERRMQTIQLRCFRNRRQLVEQLLEEARREYASRWNRNTIEIYGVANGDWRLVSHQPIRPLDSIVLADGIRDQIAGDIQTFIREELWYSRVGVPYRRGYLLYGPPGNGKTSLVAALAGQCKRPLYVLNLNGLDDASLQRLMQQLPEKAFLCLEDVDCAGGPVSRDEKGGPLKATMSGLLNALDGVAATHGRVAFLTTNRREVLDPALVRPGRADQHYYIGHATPEQALQLYQRFFPEAPATHAAQFAARLPPDTSMAALQEHLVRHRGQPDAALVFGGLHDHADVGRSEAEPRGPHPDPVQGQPDEGREGPGH